MQIVIDVDEELIKYFTKHNCMNDDGWFSHSSKLLNAFRNGTPLPKGHGRLIDADALNRKDVNCANVPMNFIDTAQTIIAADKAESEG